MQMEQLNGVAVVLLSAGFPKVPLEALYTFLRATGFFWILHSISINAGLLLTALISFRLGRQP